MTVTDEALTRAAGPDNSDPAQAATFLGNHLGTHTDDTAGQDEQAPQGRDEQQCRWYGDSAYGTGELRAGLDAAWQAAVIKPKPLQTAVDGGFSVDDFTVDEAGARQQAQHFRAGLAQVIFRRSSPRSLPTGCPRRWACLSWSPWS